MDEDFKAVSEDVASGPPSGKTTGEQAFDPDRYRHHLDAFDLTGEQEDQLMHTLWNIMYTFARLGWGGDPVQLIFAQIAENSLIVGQDALEGSNNFKGRDCLKMKDGSDEEK